MHVLVLTMVTPNSNYGHSNIAVEISQKPWIIAHGAKGKLPDLAPSKVLDLNTPCDRAPQELQNACFTFDNGRS